MSKQKCVLEILFDSRAKVKMLKFLFRNAGLSFSAGELAKRIQERPNIVNKELKNFVEIGLIKAKNNG